MSEHLNVTHDRFGTPHRAIIVTGAVTGLLVTAGLGVETIVALLAEVASFSFLVSYSLVHVALVVFRRADPDAYDPSFQIPDLLYPAVPVVGILLTVLVISQMATIIILLGLGIVALGAGWYIVYAREQRFDTGLITDSLEPEVSDAYRVVVPIANPETQQDLIRLAAATAKAHTNDRTPELIAVNVIQIADPSPQQNVAAERLTHQRELLEAAQQHATEMDVSLQTRAVTGQNVGETILKTLTEEDADQVLLGWQGSLTRDGYVFGPNLDAVVEQAPCEVSLVTLHNETIGTPVVLAGPGPHAPVAARRAVEFATVDGTVPTLLNIQSSTAGPDPAARGEERIADIAEQAGIEADEFETKVLISDDIEGAILEAVRGYDTICVGLSEQGETARIRFGTIAERISQQATGNVAIVRNSDHSTSTAVDPVETTEPT